MAKPSSAVAAAVLAALCLAAVGTLAEDSTSNPPIMIAFHWHLHQPIYWPYENIVDTINANRFPYSLLDIFTSRSGPYGGWPIDAIRSAQSAGLGHCGAQISFTGALQENLNNLAGGGLAFQGWSQNWREAVQSLKTSGGNPAVYLSAFGYHHPLMPLVGDGPTGQLITMQINLHRLAMQKTFGLTQTNKYWRPRLLRATFTLVSHPTLRFLCAVVCFRLRTRFRSATFRRWSKPALNGCWSTIYTLTGAGWYACLSPSSSL
jgi:hypothetical protein